MGSLKERAERGEATDKEHEEEDEEEPILREQKQRFCMFPIRHKQLWEMYKKAEASFWTGTDSLFLCDSLSTLCPVTIHLFPPKKRSVMIHIYIRTGYQQVKRVFIRAFSPLITLMF